MGTSISKDFFAVKIRVFNSPQINKSAKSCQNYDSFQQQWKLFSLLNIAKDKQAQKGQLMRCFPILLRLGAKLHAPRATFFLTTKKAIACESWKARQVQKNVKKKTTDDNIIFLLIISSIHIYTYKFKTIFHMMTSS